MTIKLSTILNSQVISEGGIIVITETRDPGVSDSASLGTIWINEDTNKFFICTDATVGSTIWESGSGAESILVYTRDPNSSDLASLGTVWINTVTNKFFICTDDTPGATVWGTDTQVTVLTETTDPTNTNSGYPLGTIWINSTTNRIFFCVDNTSNASIWKPTVEIINSHLDPTMSDYEYPIGTMWINASGYDNKTYFILVDNTTNKAIWIKNETDIYWVTEPTITGSTVVECDETLYTYNASNSFSSIDEATSLTYHWSCDGGVLNSTTGNSIGVYFTNDDRNSTKILSCYAQDDLGNISKTVSFPIQVRVVNPVDNLTLSLPNKIYTNESSFFDISVGYAGGAYILNYLWESSYDGLNWTSVFFVNPNLKLSEAIFPHDGSIYIRCTVTNLGGSVVEATTTPIPAIDIITDIDSTYLDTNMHVLENKEYYGTMVSANTVSVPTILFEVNDRIIVNDNQDNITLVNSVFDTKMNPITSDVLINNDYTSYTTTCTLMGNKVLVAYNDSNVSSDGTIKVGTLNGDTITFGDPVIFNNAFSQYIKLLPLTDNKVIVAYRDDGNNNLGGCRVGTVTGDTITFGPEYVFNYVDTNHIDICKIDDSRFAIVYSDYGTGNLGTLIIGQVTDTTIIFGTRQIYTNSAYFNSVTLVDTNKVAICYQDDTNSNYGAIVVAGIAGTTISLGAPQIFNNNGYTNYINVTTIDTNKIAISYQDVGNSGNGYSLIGTIVATTVSFGTPQIFEINGATWISTTYMNNRLIVSYKNSDNKGSVNFGEVTGNTISFNSNVIFNEYTTDFITVFELDNKIIVVYKDGGDADKGKLMVYTPYKQEITFENETISSDVIVTRLNTEYVLPIIAQQPSQEVFEKVEMRIQTIRNNKFPVYENLGKIIFENYEIEPFVINDNVLVAGDTNVYSHITQIDRSVISGDGSSVKGYEDIFNSYNTQQTAVTLLNGKYVLAVYRDNSTNGSISLGVAKYDNVNYKTKLTFNSGDVNYVSIAKLSDDKAVVCFKKMSSGSGNLFIAKVVNGELSIGGVFQFNAGATDYINVAQIDTDKFAISYQDVSDGSKGKCIIGTVSDTTPTLGTPVLFSNFNTTYISITSPSTSQVAISYRNIDNGGKGTVIVGNVSGLSVAFGTAQLFYSGSTTYTGIKRLSSNKVVIKYTDSTNSNFGALVVATISGTVLTFGTQLYFNQNETYYSSIVTTQDDVFMVIYDNYIGTKAYSRVGIVTGTTITLDNAVEINNSTTSHIDSVRINDNKILVTYADVGNSYKGTSQIVRRNINLLRSEIQIADVLPTNTMVMELLPYKIEASSGKIQSFDSTEYYHTDLNEIYSILNSTTLLTTATITTSGSYFYSRVKAVNTDELDKYITRIDIDFWTQS